MNKTELIASIAEATGESKAATAKVLNQFIETVKAQMAAKSTIQLIGFGTFKTTARAKRSGINPATGKKITIAAATMPRFVAGKALKEAANSKPKKACKRCKK